MYPHEVVYTQNKRTGVLDVLKQMRVPLGKFCKDFPGLHVPFCLCSVSYLWLNTDALGGKKTKVCLDFPQECLCIYFFYEFLKIAGFPTNEKG